MKQLLKYIVIALVIILFVFSCFSFGYYYGKRNVAVDNVSTSSIAVQPCADNVGSFSYSTTGQIIPLYYNISNFNGTRVGRRTLANFRFSFENYSSYYSFSPFLVSLPFVVLSSDVTSNLRDYFVQNSFIVEHGELIDGNFQYGVYYDGIFKYSQDSSSGVYYDTFVHYGLTTSGVISSPFDYVTFGIYSVDSPSVLVLPDWLNNREYVFQYVFYTVDGSYLALSFVTDYNGVSDYYYEPQTYFFGSTFPDNEYYNYGYNTGLAEGYDTGYDNGSSAGYSQGLTAGYNNGYIAGTNDSGTYTFFSLISSVIDAPLSTLVGLLNFEILGFNIKNLLLSLMTLGLIIAIVRIVMAK